jgi:hypothetical protein
MRSQLTQGHLPSHQRRHEMSWKVGVIEQTQNPSLKLIGRCKIKPDNHNIRGGSSATDLCWSWCQVIVQNLPFPPLLSKCSNSGRCCLQHTQAYMLTSMLESLQSVIGCVIRSRWTHWRGYPRHRVISGWIAGVSLYPHILGETWKSEPRGHRDARKECKFWPIAKILRSRGKLENSGGTTQNRTPWVTGEYKSKIEYAHLSLWGG